MWGKVLKGLVGLLVVGLVGWWLIGTEWRAFVLNSPYDKNVLFWTDAQRDAGFRMMDRVPYLVKSRAITAGDKVHGLPKGDPLPDTVDINAYMQANNVSGLVILHKGKIRHEQYGIGFNAQGRWTSFSVAKSLTSTLVGAAIKDGHIKSIDDNVADYITGLKGSAYDGVTVKQLLTMSSGVQWNEDYSDQNSDVAKFALATSEDGLNPIESYMRKLPRAHAPGTVWNYSTGETNMIGLLIHKATGKTLADYASEKIWQAYGMEADASWLLDNDGAEMSGCCVQATTRDFARLGQFMLDGLMVNGTSIAPDGWVQDATKRHFTLGSDGFGYGYQWWTYEGNTYGAQGIFGQAIYIDPDRDLVIATNSNWKDASGRKEGQRFKRAAFHKAVGKALDGG